MSSTYKVTLVTMSSGALVVAVTHCAERDVVVLQAAVLGADEGRQQAPVRVQLVEELDVVLSLLPVRRIAARLQAATTCAPQHPDERCETKHADATGLVSCRQLTQLNAHVALHCTLIFTGSRPAAAKT